MWDHDAASNYQRYVDRFFLLGSGHSQTIRLNDVIVDAVVTTQTGGGDQSHQLFVLRGQSAFEVGVVIQVIETLDEEVVGLVHIFVEAGARVQKVAGNFAFFGNLLFGECVGWLFALSGPMFISHVVKISRWFAGISCSSRILIRAFAEVIRADDHTYELTQGI